MHRGELLRACIGALLITGILLASPIVSAAPSSASTTPTTPAATTTTTPTKAKPAKKKKANSSGSAKKPYSAPPPLTAASLGLDTPLSAAVPAAAAVSTPAPAPTPPEPKVEPAPVVVSVPAALAPTQKDAVMAPSSGPRRHLSLTINPAPIIAGRYGMNVELVPFRHHGIIASAFYQTFTPAMLRVLMPKEVDTSHGAPAKVGGELGYRFYSGRDGANGFFAGVSGVAMPIAYPRVTADYKSEVTSFYAFGGAVDLGVQAITSGGFTIGGGIGGMYLAYSPPASVTPPAGVSAPSIPQPHILPRLLVAAGWSF